MMWNIGWGPVSKCNMNCQFCYSRHRRSGKGDLHLTDWLSFVEGNHGNIRSINYGTGENTLDEDWFRLVSHVREAHPRIRQALTTNGYLSQAVGANSACFRAFELGIDEVDVSLDFCDARRHGDFRGQPSAFGWAVETLELCRELGKPATIVFLGSHANLERENIDGLFEIARKFGAILRMNIFRPTRGLDDVSRPFVADYEEIVGLLQHVSDHYGILALNDTLYSARLLGRASADPSGGRSLRILSDGSITPSTYLIDERYVVANIREPSVLDRLKTCTDLAEAICRQVPPECERCACREQCAGGVLDRRYLWHGTLAMRDPYCPGPLARPQSPTIRLCNRSFASVHDGYLPTMFFTPEHD